MKDTNQTDKAAWQASERALHEVLSRAEEMQVLSIRTAFRIGRRHWFSLGLCLVLAGLLFLLMFYAKSLEKASAVMSFNYQASTSGQNPNGTRMNLSEFRSLEIAEQAIREAGLEGEMRAEDISEALSITPYVRDSVEVRGNYYINSSYNITLLLPEAYRSLISAQDMLGLICMVYKRQFNETYIVTPKGIEDTLFDLGGLDYDEMGAYYALMLERTYGYLDRRVNTIGAFESEGVTFKSLQKQVENLQTYDLNTYNAYVWENGISKNPARKLSELKYAIHRANWTHYQYALESTLYTRVVEEYSFAMSASILVPTYDSQNEFYMSRTKTGIDNLTQMADEKLRQQSTVRNQMLTIADRIQKLTQGSEAEKQAYADTLGVSIAAKLRAIVEQIVRLEDAYNSQRTRNYITFSFDDPSFLSRISIVQSGLLALGVCVLYYAALVLLKKAGLKRTARRICKKKKREG